MLVLENERAVRTDAADLGPETLVAYGAELLLRIPVHQCPRPASARNLTGKRGRLGERT